MHMKENVFLLTAIIPIFIILFNLNLHIYNNNFYLNEFERYDVYTSLGKEAVLENYNILMGYFKDKNNLDQSFFNEREKTHMVDVKNLLMLAKYLLYISAFIIAILILYIALKKDIHSLIKGIFFGSLATIIIILVLLAASLFDFSSIFLQFHFAFFSNNLWQLNPATDNLIIMFQEGFFYDSFRAILINSLITAVLILVSSIVLRHYLSFKKEVIK